MPVSPLAERGCRVSGGVCEAGCPDRGGVVKLRQKPHISMLVGRELSFCELRCKQVVNVIDGKVLGRICDIVFSRESTRVLGFVVPGDSGFHIFRHRGDMFIPFNRICKIGRDVILVELKPYSEKERDRLVEIN